MADETDTSEDNAAETVRSSRRSSSSSRKQSTEATARDTQRQQQTATADRPQSVHSGSVRGAATLTGAANAGTTEAEPYVTAAGDGYIATYPRGAYQPTVTLAWVRGQRVRKDFYDANGGDQAATTAQEAVPNNEPGGGYGG